MKAAGKASQFVRLSIWTLCLSVLTASAYAQAPLQVPFEPEVGKPGKDVEWVPTPQALVDRMLEMAQVTPQDYLIDLGSGDGRLVISAAKRGLRALGIEYEPDLVELSKQKARDEGVADKAQFVKEDLFESDFSQATVITMFLLPDINLKLRPKILDLKPGTRIVSNSFTMEEWEADETATVRGCMDWCTAFLYIVPAKVQGTWRLPQGEFRLTQSFQMISGTLNDGSNTSTITDGRMYGDQIGFSVGGAQYTGRIVGNTMEGTVKSAGSERNWKATRVDQ